MSLISSKITLFKDTSKNQIFSFIDIPKGNIIKIVSLTDLIDHLYQILDATFNV
jgi:hypothetical protein